MAHEIVLETERLVLRPLTAADAGAFAAYRRQADVARFQSWDTGYSEADALALVEAQRGVEPGDPGEWVQLGVHAGPVLIGDLALCGLPDQPSTVEVGVTLDPRHQGHGFATEALRGLLGWLFDHRRVHRVVAHCDDRNTAVQRLLLRVGFRLEGRFVEADWFKGEWTTLRVYAVLAREWPPPGSP